MKKYLISSLILIFTFPVCCFPYQNQFISINKESVKALIDEGEIDGKGFENLVVLLKEGNIITPNLCPPNG